MARGKKGKKAAVAGDAAEDNEAAVVPTVDTVSDVAPAAVAVEPIPDVEQPVAAVAAGGTTTTTAAPARDPTPPPAPAPAAAAPAATRTPSRSPTNRVHPAALPQNDSDAVTALRAKLRNAKTDAERIAIAQQITASRFPLSPSEQKQRSAKADAAFVHDYGTNEALHKQQQQSRPEVSEPAVVEAAAEAPAAVEMLTEAEAEALHNKHLSQLREMLADIENMKERQDEWKAMLEAMFAQEVDEDQRARRLFAEVMTSEAFFLGDREFRQWMSQREARGEGVGGEGITQWFTNDTLLPLTAYDCFVPCPRNLTPTGEAELAAAVDRVFHDSRTADDEAFKLHVFAVQPHHGDDDRSCTDDGRSVGLVRTGNDVVELIRGNASVKRYLDTTAALFFSTAEHSSRDEGGVLVRAFVAAGELLAIEPYLGDRLTFRTDAAALEDAASRAGIAAACVRLFASGIRSALGSRTFCFVARVVKNDGDANFTAALLNIGAMDAREYSLFTWSDLVGLMATAKVTRRRLRLPAAGSTTLPGRATSTGEYDVAEATASVTVRASSIGYESKPVTLVTPSPVAAEVPPPPSSTDTLRPVDASPRQTPAPTAAAPAVVTAPLASPVAATSVTPVTATAATTSAQPAKRGYVPPEPPADPPGALFWIGVGCVAFAAFKIFRGTQSP